MADSAQRRPLRVRVIGVIIQTVLMALVTLALLEMLFALSFRYPRASLIPLSLVRYLHVRFDRPVIQVMPECAVYDERLTYKLRPGHCTFASREFSNEYRINSLGLRDDEESLKTPHTVMLGDSLTMGWGVDQEQAFPALFERLTGQRTLNAGVSSYGTVRELRLFERVDRSELKNVVIQYMDNDVLENSQLIEKPPFVTLSRSDYERTVQEQARVLRYYPGKYAFNVLVQVQSIVKRMLGFGREAAPEDVERQADLFIRVVERSPVNLAVFNVTVLSVDAAFVEAARRAANAAKLDWVRRIRFVDASSIRNLEGALFTLDDHPTAIGHEAIAGLLVRELNGEK